MKIAILGDALDLQSAGIHQYTRQLVEALVQYDQEHEYVLVRFSKENPIQGMEQLVVGSRLGVARDPYRIFRKIPRLLAKKGVRAVFEPSHFGPFNLPWQIKRITMIHDLTPQLFPHLHPSSRHWAHRLSMPSILRNADLILTNSEYTKQDVLANHPATQGRVQAILLGRDPSFFPEPNISVTDQYRLNAPYFLFVGTIEPRKNLVMLLEAFRQFKLQDQSGTQLVIVGGKGWKSQAFYEAMANHPNRQDIIRPGFVPTEHLRALYSGATAFLYPSLYEGFGIPVVEAMSCDCPVIVANNSSLPEVGGSGAWALPTNDASAWAHAMHTVSTDAAKRSTMVNNARNELHRFDWERYVTQWKAALNTVLV